MRKIVLITGIVFVVTALYAGSIWKENNLYSPRGSFPNGEVIIVDIRDVTDLNFSVSFSSDNTYSITSNPDQNLTKFLPRISSDRKSVTNRKNQFSNKGKMQFSIASTIVGKDGILYRIYGVKSYTFNGVQNQITVSGIVSPAMVNGNRVDSGEIANFQLAFTGTRLGKFTLDNVLDEKKDQKDKDRKTTTQKQTSNYLTDKDKQKIIRDYLENMIRELMQ